MRGIDIWHDFDWATLFAGRSRHKTMTQFRHGLRLADLVIEDAKKHSPEKRAVLILTTDSDAQEGAQHTNRHYIVVVHIERYLELTKADPAVCYFALRLEQGITETARMRELLGNGRGCGSHGTHDSPSFHAPKPRLDARNG